MTLFRKFLVLRTCLGRPGLYDLDVRVNRRGALEEDMTYLKVAKKFVYREYIGIYREYIGNIWEYMGIYREYIREYREYIRNIWEYIGIYREYIREYTGNMWNISKLRFRGGY